MKLASLKAGGRDGTLIVVDRRLQRYVTVPDIAATLQQALDHWVHTAPFLNIIYQQLNDREIAGAPLDLDRVAAPLPRAYQWLDASAYLSHVERVRRSRGAEMPPSFYDDPLMYQGGSDTLLGAHQPIEAADASWGIDFEGEVAIITDDVPSGVTVANASRHIKLVLLVNDISLRNLAPAELAKGFGFLHAKPPTAFSPVAVTVDELGEAWRDHRVALTLQIQRNGQRIGDPNAGIDMQFNFAELIHHAATTRPLGAGTIIGSGTVSNHDRARGCACLIEQRILEKLDTGTATTPFLRHGDRVRIEMLDNHGQTIFGAIDQPVKITGEIP